MNYFFSSQYDSKVINIESVDFSHLNASLITSFRHLFSGCSSLKSVNFKNIQTTSLDSMHRIFVNCTSLEVISLSSLYTSKVKNYAGLVSGCTSLKILDLSNVDFSICDDLVGGMFGVRDDFIGNLQYLSIKGFKYGNNNEIPKVFANLNKLDFMIICRDENSDFLSNDKFIYACSDYNSQTNK